MIARRDGFREASAADGGGSPCEAAPLSTLEDREMSHLLLVVRKRPSAADRSAAATFAAAAAAAAIAAVAMGSSASQGCLRCCLAPSLRIRAWDMGHIEEGGNASASDCDWEDGSASSSSRDEKYSVDSASESLGVESGKEAVERSEVSRCAAAKALSLWRFRMPGRLRLTCSNKIEV